MDLKLLLADRKLGQASKLAYITIWNLAGQSPGRIVITAEWLGTTCGRSPKSAWGWLNELGKHDLIKIRDRDTRRGTITIDLYNPAAGDATSEPDEQTRFWTGSGNPKPAAQNTSAGVLEPKPPRPLNSKKVDLSTQRSAAPKTKESFFETKDAGVPQPKSPTENDRQGRGPELIGDLCKATLAATIDDTHADSQAETKRRIKSRIIAACGGPQSIPDWVAGSAANLVAYHGLEPKQIAAIINDLTNMKATGNLRNAGAYFHARAKRLADQQHLPWPRPR